MKWDPDAYIVRRETETEQDGSKYDIFGTSDNGRRPDKDGFVFDNFYGRYERVSKERTGPAVRCGNCFNDRFQIQYGEYKCIAVCECGYEQEVYDG